MLQALRHSKRESVHVCGKEKGESKGGERGKWSNQRNASFILFVKGVNYLIGFQISYNSGDRKVVYAETY